MKLFSDVSVATSSVIAWSWIYHLTGRQDIGILALIHAVALGFNLCMLALDQSVADEEVERT